MELRPLHGDLERLDHRRFRLRMILESEDLSPEMRAQIIGTLDDIERQVSELVARAGGVGRLRQAA